MFFRCAVVVVLSLFLLFWEFGRRCLAFVLTGVCNCSNIFDCHCNVVTFSRARIWCSLESCWVFLSSYRFCFEKLPEEIKPFCSGMALWHWKFLFNTFWKLLISCWVYVPAKMWQSRIHGQFVHFVLLWWHGPRNAQRDWKDWQRSANALR